MLIVSLLQWCSGQCSIGGDCPLYQGLWVSNLPERPEAGPRNISRIIRSLGTDCLHLDGDRHDRGNGLPGYRYVLYHFRPARPCSD